MKAHKRKRSNSPTRKESKNKIQKVLQTDVEVEMAKALKELDNVPKKTDLGKKKPKLKHSLNTLLEEQEAKMSEYQRKQLEKEIKRDLHDLGSSSDEELDENNDHLDVEDDPQFLELLDGLNQKKPEKHSEGAKKDVVNGDYDAKAITQFVRQERRTDIFWEKRFTFLKEKLTEPKIRFSPSNSDDKFLFNLRGEEDAGLVTEEQKFYLKSCLISRHQFSDSFYNWLFKLCFFFIFNILQSNNYSLHHHSELSFCRSITHYDDGVS